MKMKMTIDDETKRLIAEMSYDDGKFNKIADAPIDKFDIELNKKLHYSPAVNLPPAVRYLSPDHSVMVWERPPKYMSFQFSTVEQRGSGDLDARAMHTMRIPVPWQRYVLLLAKNNTIANLFMFFAKNQLKSLHNDPLYVAPILNFYQKGRLCPAIYTKIPEYDKSILGAAEAAFESVWSSGFNYDTDHAVKTLGNTGNPLRNHARDYVAMYTAWSKQSLETVVNWEYSMAYPSIHELISSSDLRHEYAGQTDDLLVNFALSAQVAQR